jgi:hypothetical protein
MLPFSLMSLLYFVIFVIVAAGVWFGVNLLVDRCPWMDPFAKSIVKYILLVLAVIVCIGYAISLIPGQGPIFRQ